jgi:hypothetical protein
LKPYQESMTDFRREVDYDGLKVSMESDRKDDFFFTGEEPEFRVIIHNGADVRRVGRLLLTWNLVGEYANETTFRPVDIDVDPKSTKRYGIPREWFSNPGRAAYRIWLLGKPEVVATIPLDQVGARIQATPFQHPLAAFNIVDKGTYDSDREEKHRLQRHADVSLYFSTGAVVIATMVAGVLAYTH